jgi:phosphatidylserine decarboxylase
MPEKQVKNSQVKHRVGEWLPSDHSVLEKWIDKLLEKIDKDNRSLDQLHPVVQEFQATIENDPELYIGFQHMFDQIPRKPPYNKDSNLRPQVRLMISSAVQC